MAQIARGAIIHSWLTPLRDSACGGLHAAVGCSFTTRADARLGGNSRAYRILRGDWELTASTRDSMYDAVSSLYPPPTSFGASILVLICGFRAGPFCHERDPGGGGGSRLTCWRQGVACVRGEPGFAAQLPGTRSLLCRLHKSERL